MLRLLFFAVFLPLALCAAITFGVNKAFAQCLVSPPSTAPHANQLTINLPSDGGAQGCTASATSVSGLLPSGVYPIGNAKCATARQIADQIVSNDNGWNDGGTP